MERSCFEIPDLNRMQHSSLNFAGVGLAKFIESSPLSFFFHTVCEPLVDNLSYNIKFLANLIERSPTRTLCVKKLGYLY